MKTPKHDTKEHVHYKERDSMSREMRIGEDDQDANAMCQPTLTSQHSFRLYRLFPLS